MGLITWRISTRAEILANTLAGRLASETNQFKIRLSINYMENDSARKYLTGTDKRFHLRPTSANKVLSLLNHLSKSKAAGRLDTISARLIRECSDLICISIRDISNQSISQGIFPDEGHHNF